MNIHLVGHPGPWFAIISKRVVFSWINILSHDRGFFWNVPDIQARGFQKDFDGRSPSAWICHLAICALGALVNLPRLWTHILRSENILSTFVVVVLSRKEPGSWFFT